PKNGGVCITSKSSLHIVHTCHPGAGNVESPVSMGSWIENAPVLRPVEVRSHTAVRVCNFYIGNVTGLDVAVILFQHQKVSGVEIHFFIRIFNNRTGVILSGGGVR